MNKIYRTVYNETTGTWVAVCEIAKTHTKSSGSVVDNATESVSGSLKAYSLTAVTAAAALLSPLMANQAQAADVLCKDDSTGVVSVKAACEIGESLVESLAVGSNAQVNSDRSFAFGNGATVGANSVDSVALGSNSQVGPGANNAFAAVGGQAKRNNSISIGVRSIADGEGAIAFGSGIPTGNNSGSYAKGEGSIAIGKRAEAVGANVTYEGAAGELALPQQVTTDQHGHQYTYNRDVDGYTGYAAQMVAIGDNASAYGNQSIAIGGNSVASGYASISIGGDDIGNARDNTTIVNYLRNDLKQELEQGGFTTPKAITNLSQGKYYVNLTTSKGVASTAFGIKAVSEGDLSNAYGVAARSVGLNSNAIGTTAFAGGDESIAFGTASKTAMNTADHATAIGYMSQVDGSKSVALGYKNKVTGDSSTAVGQNNTITGNNSGAFGDPNNISGNNSYAAGNNNTIATDNTFVLGNNVTNTLENSVYLGKGSTTATTKGSAGLKEDGKTPKEVNTATVQGITYGGFAGKNAQGIVSVGTDSSARRIQNVAAGAITATSTDAINGSQLYAVLPKYLKDDGTGNLVQAGDGDTPTAVTIGNTTYQLAQGGSGGSTTVVGTGSIKVDPTTTGASQYTVSIPVVANSGGNAATAANVANSSTGSVAVGENANIGNNVANSIAIGTEAKVERDGNNNIVIGSGSTISENGQNITVIGNNITASSSSKNAVAIGTGSTLGEVNSNSVYAGGSSSNAAGSEFAFRTADAEYNNKDKFATFSIGSDSLKRQIQNVAAGKVQKGSTDAVNGDQLYSVAVAVANTGNSLAGGATVDPQTGAITGGTGVLGESFTVNTDDSYGKIGTIVGKNIAGTGADNIEDAIKQSRTEVKKEDGSPITVTGSTTDGKTTYTVGVETQALTINDNGSVNAITGDDATTGTPNANKLVTAGDVVNVVNNTFWVASDGTKDATTGAENTTQVKASNKVTIQGKKGVKVALDANSKTFTVSGLTVSGSTPATGTSGNATATELTDADGNKYNIGGADGNTVTDLTVNGGNPAGNTTGNLKLTKDESNPDNPIYDVSLNNVVTVGDTASTSNDKPVTIDGTKGEINFTNNEGKITNVASHLKDQVAGDTTINSANTPDQFANAKNEAATVGDVLNAGWNLKVGGQDKDFVQHGDTIDFGNGKGTTAQYNNGVISFDIAKAGNSVVNTTVTNPNSGKVTGGKADQYWDSKQVQDAINKAGWKVGVGATANAQDELINAGDRVGLVAGNGVKIDQTGSNFTIATDYVFKNGNTDVTQQGGDVTAIETKDDQGNTVTYNFGDGNDNTVTGVTVNGGQDAATNAADGGNLKLTETTDQNGNPTYDISLNDEVDLSDKGSLKVGGDQQGSPVTNVTAGNIDFGDTQGSITNVASHLKDQVAGDTTINSANTPDQFANAKNEAATVGDVLNAGWNLKVGGQDKDFVQHGDTIDFGNGKGTTAQYNNGVISFDIAKAGNSVVNTTVTNPNSGKVTGGKADQYWDSKQVQDAINKAGWKVGVGATANAQDELINAGDRVGLVAGNGVKIDQTGSNFTIATDYVFKDGSGNDITQQGGDVATITTKDENGGDVTYNFGDGNDNTVTGVTVNGGQDATTNAADGGNLKLTETTDQNGNPTYDISLNDEVDLSDKGSLKVGGDQQGSPVTNVTAGNIDFGNQQGSITNVASHLQDPASKDDKGQVINPANTPDKFDSVKNEAATVGDVLNAGWNLKVGGKDADFVQHGDTVEFGNSDTVNAAYDNGVIKFNANTTPLTVNNTTGVVNAPTNPNSLVTAGDVQTAINNAGWFVNSGAVAGRGTNSGAAKTLVKAGEEVKFIAGDGMNIVQNGKEFTFNAKIVDTYGKQLPVDDNGNYVVRIVNNGNPVGIDDEGKFNTGGGGSGSGKPFTITGNDADGNTSTTTIDGVDNTPGSGVTFVGDENVKVIKQPTQGGDGTDVAVGLQNKVNVGGTSDGTANGTPNAGSVTIDGSNQNGGSITFNNTTPDNSVKVNGDSGSLNLGQGANNNPVNITNVAAGKNGTQDAVNVAQVEDVVGAANKDANGVVKTTGTNGEEYTLKTYNVHGQTEYLTNNVVEAVSKMNEQGIKFFHVNDGTQTPVAQAQNKVDSQAFGKNAVAIGVGSIAEGEDSIAIGTRNNVSGKGSGAIGDPNEVSGSGSYVLGNNNKVATDNTFVLGSNVTNTAANSVFLGDNSAANAKGAGATGTVSNATVGDISYGGFAGETSVGMVAVGNASEVRRVSGVAAGEISATSTDAINGSQLYSALSNSGVYVTGNGAAPTDANLVKLGNKAGALNFVDGKGTTAVVKGNTVTFDTVPGYADGIKAGDNVVFNYEDNTDAAGNPLYVTTTGGTTTDATDPNVKVDANGNPVKQQTTVINAKQPDLRPLQHQVEQVENNAYAGVAQAMATAGLPQAYLPGKSMVAVAGGYYKGEQGYALGVSSISDSGNWVFKATASGNSRNNFGGTVGAGYQW